MELHKTYGEQIAWDMFFGNLVGIQYHPANPADQRLELEYLARIADAMIVERNKRCHCSQL